MQSRNRKSSNSVVEMLFMSPFFSIHINIEERVSMTANRDGDLDQLDIRGVLTLRIADPSSAQICFKIQANDDSAIQFKTHPNVDKSSFKQERSIQMRDLNRPFPVNQNLEVVRWKFTSQDDTDVPLTGKIGLVYRGRECND